MKRSCGGCLGFAQKLAANDKVIRSRALSKLAKWLSRYSSHDKNRIALTRNVFVTIWKGLHYCMWMCDKPLVQEETSERIARLLSSLAESKDQICFIDCFFETEFREWPGIDFLRIDKFMMMIRRFYREVMLFLSRHGWSDFLVSQVVSCIIKYLHSDLYLNGPKYFLSDIYIDELTTAGFRELSEDITLKFIDPFIHFVATSNDVELTDHMTKEIFRKLIDQSIIYEEEGAEEDTNNNYDEHPMLKIDYARVGKVMSDAATATENGLNGPKPKYRSRNRRILETWSRHFYSMAEGVYPFEEKIVEEDEENVPDVSDEEVEEAAAQRLIEFEEEVGVFQSRAEKKKINRAVKSAAKKLEAEQMEAKRRLLEEGGEGAEGHHPTAVSTTAATNAPDAKTDAKKKRKRKRNKFNNTTASSNNDSALKEAGSDLKELKRGDASLEATADRTVDDSGDSTKDANDASAKLKLKDKQKSTTNDEDIETNPSEGINTSNTRTDKPTKSKRKKKKAGDLLTNNVDVLMEDELNSERNTVELETNPHEENICPKKDDKKAENVKDKRTEDFVTVTNTTAEKEEEKPRSAPRSSIIIGPVTLDHLTSANSEGEITDVVIRRSALDQFPDNHIDPALLDELPDIPYSSLDNPDNIDVINSALFSTVPFEPQEENPTAREAAIDAKSGDDLECGIVTPTSSTRRRRDGQPVTTTTNSIDPIVIEDNDDSAPNLTRTAQKGNKLTKQQKRSAFKRKQEEEEERLHHIESMKERNAKKYEEHKLRGRYFGPKSVKQMAFNSGTKSANHQVDSTNTLGAPPSARSRPILILDDAKESKRQKKRERKRAAAEADNATDVSSPSPFGNSVLRGSGHGGSSTATTSNDYISLFAPKSYDAITSSSTATTSKGNEDNRVPSDLPTDSSSHSFFSLALKKAKLHTSPLSTTGVVADKVKSPTSCSTTASLTVPPPISVAVAATPGRRQTRSSAAVSFTPSLRSGPTSRRGPAAVDESSSSGPAEKSSFSVPLPPAAVGSGILKCTPESQRHLKLQKEHLLRPSATSPLSKSGGRKQKQYSLRRRNRQQQTPIINISL